MLIAIKLWELLTVQSAPTMISVWVWKLYRTTVVPGSLWHHRSKFCTPATWPPTKSSVQKTVSRLHSEWFNSCIQHCYAVSASFYLHWLLLLSPLKSFSKMFLTFILTPHSLVWRTPTRGNVSRCCHFDTTPTTAIFYFLRTDSRLLPESHTSA